MNSRKAKCPFLLLPLVLSLACSATLAEETQETIAAYAAGYKAAFTCSATFNGKKTTEQIAAQELKGIYQTFQKVLDQLPEAVIDYERRYVSVAFSNSLPPRLSGWRPFVGCAQLPVGAELNDIGKLPEVGTLVGASTDEHAPWVARAPVNGSSGNVELDRLAESVFQGDKFDPVYGKDAFTTAVLIANPQTILLEHYTKGYTHRTSQRTWSVAKSIAATVIGAAVHHDLIEPGDPVAIKSWQQPLDPRRHITLENLLHMASGLDSNKAGNRTDRLYAGGGRVSDTAASNALEVLPGSRWKYANNDTVLAMLALRDVMSDQARYLRFPFEQVLHRIGMMDTYLETDWQGDFIMSSQVWTTSRDLARLGILYLNNGRWGQEQVFPPNWLNYVSTPAKSQPAQGSRGYGAQFWLYLDYQTRTGTRIPADAIAARGNRGQFLMIIPSRNLVIVRRGHDPAGGEGFKLELFVEAVLDALKD